MSQYHHVTHLHLDYMLDAEVTCAEDPYTHVDEVTIGPVRIHATRDQWDAIVGAILQYQHNKSCGRRGPVISTVSPELDLDELMLDMASSYEVRRTDAEERLIAESLGVTLEEWQQGERCAPEVCP